MAGLQYQMGRYSEVCIVAMGKAGAAMFDAVDALLPDGLKRRAVVTAPIAPERSGPEIQYFQGGHPEPDGASSAAAQAALVLVESCAADALVMFLVSGGASAMLELPLYEDVSLADTVLLHRLLIASGATIAEVNSVRKHFSAVKGGRLAVHAGARDKLTLLVSDVPDGALGALGSGPSLPDSSTVADCLSVLRRYGLTQRLPALMQRCLLVGLGETPKQDHLAFRNAASAVLLDNGAVLEQAKRIATDMGYAVEVDCDCDDWAYEDAAKYLLAKLEMLRGSGRRVCLLSGGEVTVRLPETVGIGGRNSQFCLSCVEQGIADGVTILSAGTDGVDGNSVAAGALADWTTRQRGEQMGLEIQTQLRRLDAYTYFAALGDSIETGPTGNNLRDLRLLLWDPDAR